MTSIRYRCRERETDAFCVVEMDRAEGRPICSCGGTPDNVCAHLDATLIEGERFMVPEADRAAADEVAMWTKFALFGPPFWDRTWRRDYAWRGVEPPADNSALGRLKKRFGADYVRRPKVCFTGDGILPRDDYLEQARQRGWRAVDSFQADVKVMVAADPSADVAKLRKARAKGIPVIAYDDWERLTLDGTLASERSEDDP